MACLLGADAAWANGVIIVEPIERIRPTIVRPVQPLQMLVQKADVKIRDLAAVTQVDQTFGNPNSYDVEGTYLFPVPEGFNVSEFAMTVNGKKVTGELLDAEKARRIYQEIVSKRRDPGLLEFVGQRLYRARVFPIPANGKVEVAIQFTGQLEPAAGLVTYRYPLTPDRPLGNIERFEFAADIETTGQLANVFSPTHEVDVDHKGPRRATVRYKASDLEPNQDLLLYYRLSDEQFGLSLLTYRESGQDGYFIAWISPRRETKVDALPKDICFVIDTSGSMAEHGGKKIQQAREALQFCLQNLSREDRFNVIAFSTEVRPFADDLVAASRDQVRRANEYVQDLKAIGGTDINAALVAAMKMQPNKSDRPYMVVFLTDGMPTVGVTRTEEILANVKKAAGAKVRLFVFGVGHDVNTALLDRLAQDNRGTRAYVAPDEDLEVKLSAFYKQIASPVLTDLELRVEDVKVYDVYPKQLPDLFAGSDLVVVGRYSDAGRAKVVLTGRQGEQRSRYTYDREFPRADRAYDFLPRLWAMRKVGYLLDEIRLHGENEELKKEVVDLAKRFGIVTPYTSYLVLEDERMLGERGGGRAMRDALGISPMAPAAAAAGRAAAAPHEAGKAQVDLSRSAGRLQETQGFAMGGAKEAYEVRLSVPARTAPPGPGQDRQVRREVSAMEYAAGRAFYRQADKWVDSLYDGKAEPKKVKSFSEEYFDLLRRHPEIKSILSLGPNVVFMVDSQVYETTE